MRVSERNWEGERHRKRLFRDETYGHAFEERRTHHHHDQQGITSYFFTNFPDSYGREDIWKFFFKWGSVKDVHIPSRKDKFGKRFGFVRFKDVRNPKELESKLDFLWIGLYKLNVNLPKYNKGISTYHINKGHYAQGYTNTRPGVSYARIVVGADNNTLKRKKEIALNLDQLAIKNNVYEFNVSEEETTWLKGSYVGHLFNLEEVTNIQELLKVEGITTITAIPMGGHLVLLSTEVEEEITSLIQDNTSCFSKWFECLVPWKPEIVSKEGLVWVSFTGVPIHAWSKTFFMFLANLVRRFIKVVVPTLLNQRLDVGKALLAMTSIEPINKVIQVNINNATFPVRISEEFLEEIIPKPYHLDGYEISEVIESESGEGSYFSSEDISELLLYQGHDGGSTSKYVQGGLNSNSGKGVVFVEDADIDRDGSVKPVAAALEPDESYSLLNGVAMYKTRPNGIYASQREDSRVEETAGQNLLKSFGPNFTQKGPNKASKIITPTLIIEDLTMATTGPVGNEYNLMTTSVPSLADDTSRLANSAFGPSGTIRKVDNQIFYPGKCTTSSDDISITVGNAAN